MELSGWQLFSTWLGIFAHDLFRYLIPASGFFLVFWVLKKNDWRHLRIRDETPPRSQMWLEVRYSMSTVAIFSLVGLFLYVSARAGRTRIYPDVSEKGWLYLVLSTILVILLHDAYFYWTHRAMHVPGLYRLVHGIHHRSWNPTPWAAYSFHPFEAIVQAAFFPIVVFTVPLHALALFAFLAHMIVRNVIGHLGYEFLPASFLRSPFTRWVTTTTHHDLHHRFPKRNFGLYFTWWDELFRTTHPGYRALFDHIRSRGSRVGAGAILALSLFGGRAESAEGVEGRWTTIDEHTRAPRAVVRIEIVDGSLRGVVESVFPRDGEPGNPTCGRCPGNRRGQGVVGMTILQGFRLERDRWVGGTILDRTHTSGSIGRPVRVELLGRVVRELALRTFVGTVAGERMARVCEVLAIACACD